MTKCELIEAFEGGVAEAVKEVDEHVQELRDAISRIFPTTLTAAIALLVVSAELSAEVRRDEDIDIWPLLAKLERAGMLDSEGLKKARLDVMRADA